MCKNVNFLNGILQIIRNWLTKLMDSCGQSMWIVIGFLYDSLNVCLKNLKKNIYIDIETKYRTRYYWREHGLIMYLQFSHSLLIRSAPKTLIAYSYTATFSLLLINTKWLPTVDIEVQQLQRAYNSNACQFINLISVIWCVCVASKRPLLTMILHSIPLLN